MYLNIDVDKPVKLLSSETENVSLKNLLEESLYDVSNHNGVKDKIQIEH